MKKHCNSGTDKLLKVKLGEHLRTDLNTLHCVQGHQVKYWNRKNSAADCSIAFKFGTEFHLVTGDTVQMFKVRGHWLRSWGQRSRLQRNVMYQQQRRYNIAMDRFGDFKLGMAQAASSCNAFASATFSSLYYLLKISNLDLRMPGTIQIDKSIWYCLPATYIDLVGLMWPAGCSLPNTDIR